MVIKTPILSVRQIVRTFAERCVLDRVNLDLYLGEKVCLQGASGSGKSTLLHLIGGLDCPDKGEIIIEQNGLKQTLRFDNDEWLSHYRRHYVGLVFQFHYLVSGLTALENIEIPLKLKGIYNEETKEWMNELGDLMGIRNRWHLRPHQLSGGEQQRMGLMRALVHRPALILCDEPTGNLDSLNASKVTELLMRISERWENTLLVVTHDPSLAQNFERRLWIRDGRLSLS
jgi:ABC-type lipoprotein export system ATPase subunit